MKQEVVAAGILPFSVTPGGKVMFLLGQESSARGEWRDSSKWDAFGGRRDLLHEKTPEETAAREFYEESGGVVCDRQFMLEQLQQNKYTTYYDTYVRGCRRLLYRTYVVRVPFKQYPDQFSTIYNYLRYHNQDYLLEKKQLRWFSMQQLKESVGRKDGIVTATHLCTRRVLMRGHFACGLSNFFALKNVDELLK